MTELALIQHAPREEHRHGDLCSYPNNIHGGLPMLSVAAATIRVNDLYQAYVLSLPDESTPTPTPGAVTHADLLWRVNTALGWDRFGPIQLVDGTRVVHRTSTAREEHTVVGYRRWWTHVDRTIADDLEDFADDLGVLGDDERLTPAPACSRCKCMEVIINEYGYYQKQCGRCTAWKRSRRGYGRCADCGRPHDRHNLGGSRCGECHGRRQDRAARETPDHREERLYKQARYRFLTPPWERRPRDW
jgi:hypothetical protein